MDVNAPELSDSFGLTYYVLSMIKNPSDIKGLAHGTDPTTVLPATVKVMTENGTELECAVTWDPLEQISGQGDSREPATYKAKGHVVFPSYLSDPHCIAHDVEMFIEVDGAPTVPAPKASLETGTYYSAQDTTLSTLEGGLIYYTTDGSEPDIMSGKLYEGENILINGEGIAADDQGQKLVILKAIAFMEGCWDSTEVTYYYTLVTGLDEDPVSHSIRFDLDGGFLDGKTGVITKEYEEETAPDDPTDDPTDPSADTGDESAQNSDGTAVDSGDHSHIHEWMTVYVITFLGLITCIVIRKKETNK